MSDCLYNAVYAYGWEGVYKMIADYNGFMAVLLQSVTNMLTHPEFRWIVVTFVAAATVALVHSIIKIGR